MATGDYQIPFDKDGNQMPWYWRESEVSSWEENCEFIDEITITGVSRGRSAANFEGTRRDGRTVSFFMKDMFELIPFIVRGKVSGVFQFVKRGTNYGCRFVRES